MEKQLLYIKLDFLAGPVWPCEGDDLDTGISVVDTDDIVRTLHKTISDMNVSYYHFDYNDKPCWFDTEQEKRDKHILLSLITQLINRLKEINDGSYTVIDQETARITTL